MCVVYIKTDLLCGPFYCACAMVVTRGSFLRPRARLCATVSSAKVKCKTVPSAKVPSVQFAHGHRRVENCALYIKQPSQCTSFSNDSSSRKQEELEPTLNNLSRTLNNQKWRTNQLQLDPASAVSL